MKLLPLLRQLSLYLWQGEKKIFLSNPTAASEIWENIFKELK